MKIKTRDIETPYNTTPTLYQIELDLGSQGTVSMTFTNRLLAQQEFYRIKTQAQFGGVWIQSIKNHNLFDQ